MFLICLALSWIVPQASVLPTVIEDWSNLNRWSRKGSLMSPTIRETSKTTWLKAKSPRVLDSGDGFGKATLEVDIPKDVQSVVAEIGAFGEPKCSFSVQKSDGKGGWVDADTVTAHHTSTLELQSLPVDPGSHVRLVLQTNGGLQVGQIVLGPKFVAEIAPLNLVTLLGREFPQFEHSLGLPVSTAKSTGIDYMDGGGKLDDYDQEIRTYRSPFYPKVTLAKKFQRLANGLRTGIDPQGKQHHTENQWILTIEFKSDEAPKTWQDALGKVGIDASVPPKGPDFLSPVVRRNLAIFDQCETKFAGAGFFEYTKPILTVRVRTFGTD